MSASVPPPSGADMAARPAPEPGLSVAQQREAEIAELRRAVASEARRRNAVIPNVLDILGSLCRVIVAAVFVLTFIAQPFRIPSESMEHTLLVGDFLLVNKMTYAPAGEWKWLLPYRDPRRDDVIVFHYPVKPPEHLVKRVIGTPGDSVDLQNGIARVNGAKLNEPYANFEPAYPDAYRDDFPQQRYTDPGVRPSWWEQMRADVRKGELMVPQGEYFVLGDNRNFSSDSRYWGLVPRANIVGRAFLIYFSVRERSATDPAQNDSLRQKNDLLDRLKDFARWDRMGRVVR